MQILRINPYRNYSTNTQNRYNTVPFGDGIKNDNDILLACVKRFDNLLSIGEVEDEFVDAFFEDLLNLPLKIQVQFLEKADIHSYEAPIRRAIRFNEVVADKFFDYIKKAEYPVRRAFYCADGNPYDSPLVLASELTSYNLASEMFKYLVEDKDNEELRKVAFNMIGSSAKGSGIKRVGDAIREAGHYHLAMMYEVAEKNYLESSNRSSNGSNLIVEKAGKDNSSGRFTIVEKSKVKFSDVGGMFNVKKEIKNQFLSILDNPKAKNKDKPSAVLLEGTPGTGKTLLAMAIAGEADLPFISTVGSSFVEVYVGAGAKHVRELYAKAREIAKNHPSKSAIVFIDEIDAVGGKRGSGNNGERDATLNALLTEMDGVASKQNDDIKIITIAATNRADMLDDALRNRRFDLEFAIDDPRFSAKARTEIIKIHLQDKPFENEEIKTDIIKHIAKISSGMSGADIEKLIKRAYRQMLAEHRDFIVKDDIEEAYLNVQLGIVVDAESHKDETINTIAHEFGHATCGLVMADVFKDETSLAKKPRRELQCIINVGRGHTAGATVYKPADNRRWTIESLIDSLVVTYGGYGVEETLYDSHTDGVRGDLQVCTERIVTAVSSFGLGSKTRYLSSDGNNKIYELFKWDIKKDIVNYSELSMGIASRIAKFSADFIKNLAEAHYDKAEKNISGEDYTKLFKDWIESSGKQEEYDKLCKEIREEIDVFASGMRAKSQEA